VDYFTGKVLEYEVDDDKFNEDDDDEESSRSGSLGIR
jgi:hypothetical protein